MEEREEKTTAILQAEEVQDTPVMDVPPATANPETSWAKFPPQVNDVSASNEGSSSRGLIIFVVILIALAVGVVGFVVYKSNSMSKTPLEASPTPTPSAEEVVTPTVTPTPAIVDKSEVRIQVLNGSGVVGQAGQIATALEKDDFKTPDTGNYDGDKQSDTVVNYTANVDKTLVDDVLSVLKKTFTNVTASVSASLTDFDIQIITGTGK